MAVINATSQIAAFATIKSLSDEKRYHSTYQLLGNFIKSIIIDKSIFSFQSSEMKSMLLDTFGFDIPEAVIKSTARKMTGISLSDGIYSVSVSDLELDPLFAEKKKEADETNTRIIALLVEYIQERTGEPALWTGALTQELVRFLVGDPSESGRYTDIISEFILKYENNDEIQDFFNRVKEGSVLYIGLNYNINETGSITKPLTLYLGTEILFSLIGYNGTIHKQFAVDFYNLVRSANIGGTKRITLRYFSDVKKEIDDFFLTASEIVDGRRSQYSDKTAMAAIINGCQSSSDVSVKQADFYHAIQYGYGIVEDTTDDLYDEEFFESNLESFDYVDEDDKKKKKEVGIKYISHIHKLRNGQLFSNDIDSEYLLVTNTKATLLISKEQSDKIKENRGMDYIANFAISLDSITSLLWYKLGNGFGNNEFPSNVRAVLGARVVLSSSIAKKAGRAYFDIKKQYESGKISKEQLAGRIITLKHKPALPEELQWDGIAEIMDFSPEFLSRYEEEHKTNQKALEEKERIINELMEESSVQLSSKEATIAAQEATIIEKNKTLSERDETIATQSKCIEAQNAELEKYHQQEVIEKKKKEKRKRILCFIGNILWKVVIIAIIVIVSVLICNKLNANISTIVGLVVGIIGTIPTAISVIKRDIKILSPKEDR